MIKVKFSWLDSIIIISIMIVLFIAICAHIVLVRETFQYYDALIILILFTVIFLCYRGLAFETKNIVFEKDRFIYFRPIPFPGKKYIRSETFLKNIIDQITIERGRNNDRIIIKLINTRTIQLTIHKYHKLFKPDTMKILESLDYKVCASQQN